MSSYHSRREVLQRERPTPEHSYFLQRRWLLRNPGLSTTPPAHTSVATEVCAHSPDDDEAEMQRKLKEKKARKRQQAQAKEKARQKQLEEAKASGVHPEALQGSTVEQQLGSGLSAPLNDGPMSSSPGAHGKMKAV